MTKNNSPARYWVLFNVIKRSAVIRPALANSQKPKANRQKPFLFVLTKKSFIFVRLIKNRYYGRESFD